MKLLHLKPIIFSFGCPRSGTTFIEEAFSYLPIHTQKIHEGSSLHPCQSDTGLLTLQDIYRNRKILFIRTFRDPIQIFESFRAMDGTVGKQKDERIFDFIETEHKNFRKQKLDNCVEIDFDALSTETHKEYIAHRIGLRVLDKGRIKNVLNKYGHNPIRKGRLSMGITESLLTDEEKQEIKAWSSLLK